ncbi:hypothetical protein J4204_01230 [Candidatus Woesearchaeota archaeon]|nr:hypothetical protein [Candidatus Woesearchaeota archaeon]
MYIFSNVLGVFVFDEKINVVEEVSFGSFNNEIRDGLAKSLKGKYNAAEPDEAAYKNILHYFNNKKFFADFRDKNLQLTKSGVKNSVGNDILVIQAVNSIGELDKAINIIVKRLREWYELYNPEASRAIEDHEKFVESVLEKGKSELLRELKISQNESIGADLRQEDLEPIKSLAHQVHDIYQLRKAQFDYIASLMDLLCPNIKAVCDVLVGAKLIEHAGSLKRMSIMPSSTIQILGAEKALFRHMKTGAKSPKHGVIISHPLIANSPPKMHGKIARALADKISIAAKIDYFKGKFIGDKLREGLEKKFEGIVK